MRQWNAEKVKAVYGTNLAKSRSAPHESTRQSRWLSALMRLGTNDRAEAAQRTFEAGDTTAVAQQEKAAAGAAEPRRAVAFDGTTKERLEHSFRTSVAVRLIMHEKRFCRVCGFVSVTMPGQMPGANDRTL